MSDDTANAKAVVTGFMHARATRDAKRIAEFLTEDARLVLPRSFQTAETEATVGRDALSVSLAGDLTSTFFIDSTLERTATRITAEGDVVIVEQVVTGQMYGGIPYENTYVWVYELRDGKIARAIEYSDTLYASKTIRTSRAALRSQADTRTTRGEEAHAGLE